MFALLIYRDPRGDVALLLDHVTHLTSSSVAVSISETVAGRDPPIVGNGAYPSVYAEQAGHHARAQCQSVTQWAPCS
jgi:hypothetical protein